MLTGIFESAVTVLQFFLRFHRKDYVLYRHCLRFKNANFMIYLGQNVFSFLSDLVPPFQGTDIVLKIERMFSLVAMKWNDVIIVQIYIGQSHFIYVDVDELYGPQIDTCVI